MFNTYEECLKAKFGHDAFRQEQRNIVDTIIEARRDICVIMSTGHGKSLCYQFPPTWMGKPALVISPLISLMEDQQQKLSDLGISSCCWNSTSPNKTLLNRQILEGKYLIIYTTPESISANLNFILEMIKKIGISLIAIDEAHCISMWGNSFRPTYMELKCLKKQCPDIPILALTGTATERVKQDMIQNLGLVNPLIIRTTTNRPNLSYFVKKKSSQPLVDLYPEIEEIPDSSVIIYCPTRQETENIAFMLTQRGVRSEAYHAGMTTSKRSEIQQGFMLNEILVIVATISFGMGIDKSDIRKVIHYGCPKDIESYVQETGRAGRDGHPSRCVVYYSGRDVQLAKNRINNDNGTKSQNMIEHQYQMFQAIECYLNILSCRRQYLLSYFGDDELPEKPEICCDNCFLQPEQPEGCDITDQIEPLMTLLNDYPSKYGKKIYIDVLMGRKNKKIPDYLKCHSSYGLGRYISEDEWKYRLNALIRDGYLKEKRIRNSFGSLLDITPEGKDWHMNPNHTYTILLASKTSVSTTIPKLKPIQSSSKRAPPVRTPSQPTNSLLDRIKQRGTSESAPSLSDLGDLDDMSTPPLPRSTHLVSASASSLLDKISQLKNSEKPIVPGTNLLDKIRQLNQSNTPSVSPSTTLLDNPLVPATSLLDKIRQLNQSNTPSVSSSTTLLDKISQLKNSDTPKPILPPGSVSSSKLILPGNSLLNKISQLKNNDTPKPILPTSNLLNKISQLNQSDTHTVSSSKTILPGPSVLDKIKQLKNSELSADTQSSQSSQPRSRVMDGESSAAKLLEKIKQIENNQSRVPKVKLVVKGEQLSKTQLETYNLFTQDKLQPKEIAIYRNMAVTTIEGHLVQAIKYGYPIDFDRLQLTKVVYQVVESAINQLNQDTTKLKPIREIVGKKISYFQIKCSIAMFEANGGCSDQLH